MDMVKQKLLKALLVSIRALVKSKPALGPTSSPDLRLKKRKEPQIVI